MTNGLTWSLDHVRPFTRTVRDTALLMAIISSHDPHHLTTNRLAIAVDVSSLTGDVAGLRVCIQANSSSRDARPTTSRRWSRLSST
jgi:aspartyl-tRNA(Asn)/glutamyl-tRNA(Gln) amidotransferase subunit A